MTAAQRYYEKNKAKIAKRARAWRNTEEGKKKIAAQNKRRRKKSNEWYNERYANDFNFRLRSTLRARMNRAVKGKARTMELIGCTLDELKEYIEKQFTEGMSWDNYGEWEIDHIKPCTLFDLTDEEQQKVCFHYTNLQPLWSLDNIKKGAHYG